jgi:hypothetical protein
VGGSGADHSGGRVMGALAAICSSRKRLIAAIRSSRKRLIAVSSLRKRLIAVSSLFRIAGQEKTLASVSCYEGCASVIAS